MLGVAGVNAMEVSGLGGTGTVRHVQHMVKMMVELVVKMMAELMIMTTRL